jgi:UDP-N-acetylmuramoyl-L-alanyl-D-glutamate--2,6-diaminopimelate ligase
MKKISEILNSNKEKYFDDILISSISLCDKDINNKTAFFALEGARYNPLNYLKKVVSNKPAFMVWDKKNTKNKEAQRICKQKNIPFLVMSDLSANLSHIADRFYDHPSQKITTIGITGTDGKTSITNLFCDIVGEKKCGIIGTLGYRDKDGNFISTGNTTPDAFLVQKILYQFVVENKSYAVIEVSSHAIAQYRVRAVNFTRVLISNLGSDHLDYHKSIENYHHTKLSWIKKERYGIYNIDDEKCKKEWQKIKDKKQDIVNAYSLETIDDKNVLSFQQIKTNKNGINIKIDNKKISLPFFALFNASNILAAVALCVTLSIDYIHKLKNLKPVIGRMQQVCKRVFVDFAHTEQALKMALMALREHFNQNIFLVFGCGGDRDASKRAKMGKVADKYADFCIVTDDNPRYENPKNIIADIYQGVSNKNKFITIHNRKDAIRVAMEKSYKTNYVLLVAGKGAENLQDYGDNQKPYNDIDTIKSLCR